MIRAILILFLLCSCATSDGPKSYKKSSYNYNYNRSRKSHRSPSVFSSRRYTKEIIGSSSKKISSILGEPELKRFDYPSEIWLYPKEDSTLFIFFEQTDKGNIAKYVEARENKHDSLIDTDEFIKRNF